MKNIYEILKSVGVEIPEDKKETFDKAVNENYKTIKEVEGINGKLQKAEQERDTYKTKYDEDIATRDTDLATLKQQLEDAGIDKKKLDELNLQLSTLQSNYDTAKSDYEKQLAKQKKEFLTREKVNGLKFTSNGAKKSFLADIIAKDLPVEGDTILGFDDFVNAYREQDAGAFVTNADDDASNGNGDNGTTPRITGKSTGKDNPDNSGKEGNDSEAPKISPIW